MDRIERSACSRVILTRRWAMMRRPDCSIIELMAPVRLRIVASGLMIENVRSIAIRFIRRWDWSEKQWIAAASQSVSPEKSIPSAKL